MAANQTNSLLKLNQLAKDLNMKTKDVCTVLEEKGIEAKSQATLKVKEFEMLFEELTKKNQITDILDYLDGITYIPSKKPAAEGDKPAAEEKKEEPKVEPKVEVKPEPKAEPKVEAKPEPKAEPKVEPKVEAKPEPKVEPKVEIKPEPKAEAKTEPKAEPKKATPKARTKK